MKGYTQDSYSCPAQHEHECCVYPIDAAARVFTLEVAEDKTRFDQTAICLQGSGEDVLSGIGLQLADEQRRRHPPELERTSEPQQIIPVPQDEVLPDRAFDARGEMAGSLLPGQAIELLTPKVPEAWGKLHAQYIKQGTDHFGEPGRIHRMLDNRELRSIVQDGIQDISGIADGGRPHFCPVWRALIRRPGKEGEPLVEEVPSERRTAVWPSRQNFLGVSGE